jgi:hypothetical protein
LANFGSNVQSFRASLMGSELANLIRRSAFHFWGALLREPR